MGLGKKEANARLETKKVCKSKKGNSHG